MTTITLDEAGAEERFSEWELPRYSWTVAMTLRNLEQAAALITFFNARKGRAYGFRFKDWSDFEVPEPPQATVAIDGNHFQLVKRYVSGPSQIIRTIYKPVEGTVRMFQGNVELTTGWTVDTTTGVVTFPSAPGFTPNAAFEFDLPVRFDTDQMRMVLREAMVRDWEGVPIVELKEDDES